MVQKIAGTGSSLDPAEMAELRCRDNCAGLGQAARLLAVRQPQRRFRGERNEA